MTLKEELNQTMKEIRQTATKKRTIYGYDIIKAVNVAFRMAKDEGLEGDEAAVMKALLNILTGDDFVYDVLHAKAEEEYEKAMKTGGYLDDFINKLSNLMNDVKSDSDDKEDVGIVELVADLFGVKKEDKE